MANLSSFTGGGVKNVQRGTASLAYTYNGVDIYGSTVSTVTISPVVTSKSSLNFSFRNQTQLENNIMGVLTNATTLTFTLSATLVSGNNSVWDQTASVSWEVIEYN